MKKLFCAAAAVAFTSSLGFADTYTFTNAGGDNAYTNGSNWLDTTTSTPGAVPNTANGDLATIANGSPVTYTPGGDLTFSNGGELEISNGSFTQVVGPAYIQLAGNGTILVDGGTFNQGSASSTPFNVSGTGNAFTVSSGVANINSSFNMNVGLTFTQTGGTVNVTGAETDFNSTTNFLNGGIFNTALITGVNGGTDTFNISAGVLNLSSMTAIYGGGSTQYINFTPGSNGSINFTNSGVTVAQVQGFINASVIEFNNTANSSLSLFNIQQNANSITLSLVTAVPEPSSVALLFAGLGAGAIALLRKRQIA